MSLVAKLKARMSLPVIGAPMFIVGVPALVIEQCIHGVIGSFPALNARPAEKSKPNTEAQRTQRTQRNA